jgi:hypothetical protein
VETHVIRTYMRSHTYTHTHTHTYIYIYTYIHTHTHTHTHTHIHIYTHTGEEITERGAITGDKGLGGEPGALQ